MSRRDTIIIAVLLNAGLLIVLFATNLKSGPEDSSVPEIAVVTPKIEEAVVAQAPAAPTGDPIDQMLKSYTPPLPATETGAAATNFAADLQAIASPAAPDQITMPSPVVQTPADTHFKEHKVKKGEVLERIARQHHVSVDELMRVNGLSTSRLKIGQTLKIPAKGSAPKSSSSPASAPEGGVKYYTVKNGDNPWTIAVKNHMKVEELLKLNNLDEDKARRLKPGDQIRIR